MRSSTLREPFRQKARLPDTDPQLWAPKTLACKAASRQLLFCSPRANPEPKRRASFRAAEASTYYRDMDILKPLIALLAIVNPIGVVPFFIHFTQAFSREERQRTIRISAFSAFVVIAVSALAGLKIIEFFGISLASFQVGGGCQIGRAHV